MAFTLQIFFAAVVMVSKVGGRTDWSRSLCLLYNWDFGTGLPTIKHTGGSGRYKNCP